MKFHAITGLPRSGSTLLANLLNQNPSFHASSTSALAASVGGLQTYWSNSPEIKSDLANDRERTEAKLRNVVRFLIAAWYPESDEGSVIFDKGRGWMTQVVAMSDVMPGMRFLCCVRDPREVFASIERQHRKFPLLEDSPAGETTFAKAERLFSPGGFVGGPLTQIEDALRNRHPSVVPVVYESLVSDPEKELRKVYAELKQDYPSGVHHFDDVQNTSTDLDALYLNKFPHEGSGKVEKRPATWPDVVPGDVAAAIMQRYAGYARAFGYS